MSAYHLEKNKPNTAGACFGQPSEFAYDDRFPDGAHGRPRTDSLFRREDPLDPRTREDDRTRRRLAELEPAQLLRHEVSARQRLSRDPGQSGHRGQDRARRDGLRVAARHSGQGRHGRHVPRAPRKRPASSPTRSRSAPRSCGCNWAIRNDEAAASAEAAGNRSHHEPLPEDRVRAARRRIVVERRQQRHHPQPPARPRRCRAGSRAARRRRATSTTASRPAPSMPAPRPIRRPARARRRSTRRRPMCSTTSTTPPRCSICTISATSIRG